MLRAHLRRYQNVAVAPDVCTVAEPLPSRQEGERVLQRVRSVQPPRFAYDSYFRGECRQWKAGSLVMRALKM